MTGMPALMVAVVQWAPGADVAANVQRIDELTAVAASRGAKLVVFPEYASYFVDPLDESLAANAEGVDGSFVQGLRGIASRYGVTIVAGLIETASSPGRVRNALVAVDADGLRAVYRKLHLYDAFGQRESDWVEPGVIGAPHTFVIEGMTFGLMTCYDLRFPEVARTLVDAGVDAIVVPAAWMRGARKEHHWETLLAARAIENTSFVVAADHPPPLGVGGSRIIDPQGVTLAGVGTATDIAVASLDPDAIDRVRRVNPALALRRFRVTPVQEPPPTAQH